MYNKIKHHISFSEKIKWDSLLNDFRIKFDQLKIILLYFITKHIQYIYIYQIN